MDEGMPHKLLSAADVASRWAVTPQTIRNMARQGKIPQVRVCAHYRFDPAEIEAFEKKSGERIECPDQERAPPAIASQNAMDVSMRSGGTGHRSVAFHSGQQIARKQSAH